jgi:hypothetical protein
LKCAKFIRTAALSKLNSKLQKHSADSIIICTEKKRISEMESLGQTEE